MSWKNVNIWLGLVQRNRSPIHPGIMDVHGTISSPVTALTTRTSANAGKATFSSTAACWTRTRTGSIAVIDMGPNERDRAICFRPAKPASIGSKSKYCQNEKLEHCAELMHHKQKGKEGQTALASEFNAPWRQHTYFCNISIAKQSNDNNQLVLTSSFQQCVSQQYFRTRSSKLV